ncbi:MAG: RNA polymerase sigma factor [Rhizobiaceae bacterium]|nr:RNA polymerase sigma factor [Rhizobiaceae bacterium]
MFGKKSSFDEVRSGLKPLFPHLWRYCLVLTGSAQIADDLSQSTCLRALEKAQHYTPGTNLKSWLFRMAQRIWLNELRAAAVRRGGGMTTLEETQIPDAKPGPESNLFFREVLLEVGALPEAQRVAVVLVYAEGYSYKQAAEILDIPVGTVMSRLAAARLKLNQKLNDNESKLG